MTLRTLVTSLCLVSLCLAPLPAASGQTPDDAPGAAPTSESPGSATLLEQAERSPLNRIISVDLRNATLERALAEINRLAALRLSYSARVVPVERRVTLRRERVTAAEALAEVLEGTGIEAVVASSGQVILVKRRTASAPADSVGAVGGRITAAEGGRPLAGATVEIQGTGIRMVTNDSGQYVLYRVPAGERTLLVRLIGFRPAEVPVTVLADTPLRLNVALELAALRLEELVTTATGQQRRIEVANQVTTIRADSIVQTQPIKDLTDLLETRVPGLATLPTTGAPGDPTRLRLRGASSFLYSNDPIVVVDGVRIYSEQTNGRSGSLGWSFDEGATVTEAGADILKVAAPSPLDRIDPNSIETVEVLNGPSAATLYGADAANGVIVVTTKRGRPGPARWDVSLSHGRSSMPGRFPDSYFGFARSPYGDLTDCSVPRPPELSSCVVDSVVAYQALNDPEMTVLGRGQNSALSATVSGGSTEIRYAISASYSDEVGLLQLPRYEADRYRATFGRSPEDWMERPHQLTRWSASSRFDFKLAPSADVGVTMSLAGDEQRRSNLEQQLQVVRGAYVDRTTGVIFTKDRSGQINPGTSLVPEFYRRTTNEALGLRTGVSFDWRPLRRLDVRANAGISADVRHDESLLPRGLLQEVDSTGFLQTGQATTKLATLDASGAYRVPLGWGFDLDAAVGFNFNSQSAEDLARKVWDPTGGASNLGESRQFSSRLTSYGWYVEPRLLHKRFSLSTGLRLDGGSNYGARAGGFALPKLGASWLISDEPFFPFKGSSVLGTLRLRAAYGQAGVQPGPADRLRLYSRETRQIDGQPAVVSQVSTLGNTRLRPERSTEIEGGFDADLLDGRVSIGFTAYRKTKNDALVRATVAPSAGGGGSTLINVGVVRNTGLELSLGTDLLRTDALSWSTQVQVSHNRNVVVSLADGMESFLIGGNQRVAPGYPLFGYWERPIRGYDDINGDGVLQSGEVLLGTDPEYLGAPEPDYTAALHTTVGLFRGMLTLSASLDYRDGFAQMNGAPGGALARAAVDPSAPLADQAPVVAYNRGFDGGTRYGFVQTVSMLRFNSLSIGLSLPSGVLRWVGAEQGSIAVQGRNLGLATNYRGKDPLVNSWATGNAVMDAGALPQPREWQVRMNLSY